MLAQPDSEVIIVDYACPEEAWRWVAETFPTVKVVRVTGIDGFNLADARNRGAAVARGQRLAFVDADVIVADHFIDYIDKHMTEGSVASFSQLKFGGAQDRNIKGTVIVFKRDFEFVGGYDDIFHDWGWEDTDLVTRLVEDAQRIVLLPRELLSCAIVHSDAERVRFYKRSVIASFLIGFLYCHIKRLQTRLNNVAPSREQRLALHQEASHLVDLVENEQRSELIMRYRQKRILRVSGWEFDQTVVIRGRRMGIEQPR